MSSADGPRMEKRENVEKIITNAEIDSQKLALIKLSGQINKIITMASKNQRSRESFIFKNLTDQNNNNITNARRVGIENPAK